MNAAWSVALTFVGIGGGLLGTELVALARRRGQGKRDRSLDEVVDEVKAALADHAQRTEEAMLRLFSGEIEDEED